jgi:hypothetical protein
MLAFILCLIQPPAPVLIISFGDPVQKHEFTAASLAKVPRQTVQLTGSDGNPTSYSGCALAEVLKAAKVPMGSELRGRGVAPLIVIMEASDGAKAVFAFAEVEPSFSDKVILLADQREGKALSSDEGPLRIIVPSDKRHARWLRGVAKITIKKL